MLQPSQSGAACSQPIVLHAASQSGATCGCQGDAMTLALSRGRVVFRYTFGGLSSAVLETRHTYNTNSWVTVTASRLRQRGNRGDRHQAAPPRCHYTHCQLRLVKLNYRPLYQVARHIKKIAVIERTIKSYHDCKPDVNGTL